MPFPAYINRGLIKAAKQLENEAETWADGWAVRSKEGALIWPDKNQQWAQLRWMRCTASAQFLRSLAKRKI